MKSQNPIFLFGLQIAVTLTFMVLFYLLYSSRVIDGAIENQIENTVNFLFSNLDRNRVFKSHVSDKELKSKISPILDRVDIPQHSAGKKIKTQGIVILFFVLLFFIWVNRHNFSESELAGLVFSITTVLVVEFYFTHTIAAKYTDEDIPSIISDFDRHILFDKNKRKNERAKN